MPPSRRIEKPPGEGLLRFLASDPVLLFVTAVIILAVYTLDAVTPLGEPIWLLYFIPLVLSFWSGRYYAIPTVFAATFFFLIGGYFLSPAGIAPNIAIINRFTFIVVFFAIAILLWWFRGRQIRDENL